MVHFFIRHQIVVVSKRPSFCFEWKYLLHCFYVCLLVLNLSSPDDCMAVFAKSGRVVLLPFSSCHDSLASRTKKGVQNKAFRTGPFPYHLPARGQSTFHCWCYVKVKPKARDGLARSRMKKTKSNKNYFWNAICIICGRVRGGGNDILRTQISHYRDETKWHFITENTKLWKEGRGSHRRKREWKRGIVRWT